MAAKNGYVRMHANTDHDVIAACGQQLKRLKGFRNPRAPLNKGVIAWQKFSIYFLWSIILCSLCTDKLYAAATVHFL